MDFRTIVFEKLGAVARITANRPEVLDYIDAEEARRLGLVNRVVPRAELEKETLALAERIALQDPFALKLAKASVNETMDIQGHRRAIESAFKNYMLTIPHRQALGTYGAEARAKGVKARIDSRDRRFHVGD